MPSSYCDEKKIKEEGDEKPANGQPMEVETKTKTKVEPSSLPDGKSRSVTLSFSLWLLIGLARVSPQSNLLK